MCSIIQKGYTVLHVPEIYSRAYVEPDKWGSPPPIFKEVTADNLKYDLEDAAKMQTHSMGCYSPKEISDRFPCAPYLNHVSPADHNDQCIALQKSTFASVQRCAEVRGM